MIKGYKTITEIATEWDVTPRWIQTLCKDGRIEGAEQVGKMWLIPEGTERPGDARRKAFKQGQFVDKVKA